MDYGCCLLCSIPCIEITFWTITHPHTAALVRVMGWLCPRKPRPPGGRCFSSRYLTYLWAPRSVDVLAFNLISHQITTTPPRLPDGSDEFDEPFGVLCGRWGTLECTFRLEKGPRPISTDSATRSQICVADWRRRMMRNTPPRSDTCFPRRIGVRTFNTPWVSRHPLSLRAPRRMSVPNSQSRVAVRYVKS